ncbi:MAG TPA: site-2 protease family protein [Trebonia sp.]|nr:site-2 protease family protein [Trebonia sp.]
MEWLGIAIFLVALVISVALHEFGHLVAAKSFGMKATRYFIGMGPTLWSMRLGETEYGFKAFPVGGFVKIIGMTSLDEVDPEDEPRSFRRAPAWQRVIVLAAGSFMHFVLASVLLFGLAVFLGVENDNTTQIGSVSACLPANAQAADNGAPCTATDAKSPAAIAGLRAGDEVTSFDGHSVSTYDQLRQDIAQVKPGTTVPMTVQRDGRPVTLSVKIASVDGRSGGFLGITGAPVYQTASPLGALKFTGAGWSQTVTGDVGAIASVPAEIPKLFNKQAASTGSGVTSVVGIAEVTGQVVAQPVGWKPKVDFVVQIVAVVNIFVGLSNLLPVLPLDGGHILAVFLERIRAMIARRRRRPDPGLFDLQKLVPVSFSIFAVFALFSVVVLISNVVNPVHIG